MARAPEKRSRMPPRRAMLRGGGRWLLFMRWCEAPNHSAPPPPHTHTPAAHSVVRLCKPAPHSGGSVPLRLVLDTFKLSSAGRLHEKAPHSGGRLPSSGLSCRVSCLSTR